MPKRGFPVTHTAKGANRANLANSETEAGSSANSWQRYSHSEKEERKRKGRRKKEGRLVRKTAKKGVAGRTVARRGSSVD